MAPIVNIEDLRQQAKRNLPKQLFDFVDGGAMDERTLAANRDDFGALRFLPRTLIDVGQRKQATSVLGQELAMPIVLSPTGMTGMFGPGGEVAAARAAKAAGAGYCMSTMSSTSIEDLAAAEGKDGWRFWFQLYIQRDRGVTRALVERAAEAGCPVLAVTVDLAAHGRRERDVRNGYTVPFKLTARNTAGVLARPRWLWQFLTGPKLTFANFAHIESRRFDFTTVAAYIGEQFDPAITWKDIEWLKSFWPGKLIIKGIVSPEDARLARDHGADGLLVSKPRRTPARLLHFGDRGSARRGRCRRRRHRGSDRRRHPPRHGRAQGARPRRPRLPDRPALPLRPGRRRRGRREPGAADPAR